ncbi:MAG: hypothetical protein GKS05_00210 [Nitrospirales bacterium]|nr:hypothetical protein [Nitrospirales bacterium]
MADKAFILNLGKLLIGAAWVDGTLHHKEVNALKELLFLLPDISGEDWMQLELYLVAPVSEEERHQLLQRVLDGMTSAADKTLVLETLSNLVQVDGQMDEAEVAMWETLRRDIEEKRVGLFSHLTRPIRRAVRSRMAHYEGEGRRESRLEDYIKNTVYFQLVTEMDNQGTPLVLSEQEIKKVCLAAGLLARVAWLDQEICEQEEKAMVQSLVKIWGISEKLACLVVQISRVRILKGLDVVRLGRGLRDYTTFEERKTFLRCLFMVANAANKTSNQEIEEIKMIAKTLDLSHQDFIDAKLTIPREERDGL